MWIFMNKAFVSIVEHRDDPGVLIVRGRFRGDAARFLGIHVSHEVEMPEADYRFRIEADRDLVCARVVAAVKGINYDNFKSSIASRSRHDLAMQVWTILHRAQESIARRLKSGQLPL